MSAMTKAAVPSVLVLVLLLAVAIKAEAQQLPKIPRIGILELATSATTSARIEAFRQGLRELGYVEGKNITIEYRYADGKSERIPDLAAELVNLKVDLIMTSHTPTVLAIKKVSSIKWALRP